MKIISHTELTEKLTPLQHRCALYFSSYYLLAAKNCEPRNVSLSVFLSFVAEFDAEITGRTLQDALKASPKLTQALTRIQNIARPEYTSLMASLLDDTIFEMVILHAQTDNNR